MENAVQRKDIFGDIGFEFNFIPLLDQMDFGSALDAKGFAKRFGNIELALGSNGSDIVHYL